MGNELAFFNLGRVYTKVFKIFVNHEKINIIIKKLKDRIDC